MLIDKQLSEKIKILSFLTMIMVLFIHSFNFTLHSATLRPIDTYNLQIQNFVSFHISRIAVPFFFIISGFFFFVNTNFNFNQYKIKIKKRLKTLLLPYIIWVTLWTLLFFIISEISYFKNFVNAPISKETINVYSIFNIYLSPICYQFWFIKDLIVLVIISPILYFFIKKMPLILLSVLYLNLVYFKYKLELVHLESIFYFTLGSYIATLPNKYKTYIENLDVVALGFIWLLSNKLYFIPGITYFSPLFLGIGMLFFWNLYDTLNKKSTWFLQLSKWSAYSFFLFAFHEPIQISLKKLGFAILGVNQVSSLFLYFAIPIMVFFIAIFVGDSVKKRLPKIYFSLTGGR